MKLSRYLTCVLILAAIAVAQETKQPERYDSAYKFTVTISELEGGKKTNERQYSMILRERQRGRIDTGNRVPVVTSVKSDQPPSYVYMDVGLNIEGSYLENKGNIDMELNLEMSSLVQPEVQTESMRANPVVRQVRERLSPMITPGKATVVSTLDDTASKKTFQIEVLATKLR